MDTSRFLARLVGPMFVVLGIGLLVRPETFHAMATEFLSNRGLIFLSGLLTLLAGLAIVNTHNVWKLGWPVLITILGWLGIIGGIARMLFPDTIVAVGNSMMAGDTSVAVGGVVDLALGLWLSYVGYKG
jgi:uncharacterized membrane protein